MTFNENIPMRNENKRDRKQQKLKLKIEIEIFQVWIWKIKSMEFGKFSLPPSSNWFYPHLLDVSVDGVIAYGSKSSIVVLESVQKNGK